MESLKCIIIEERENVASQFNEIIEELLPNVEIVQCFRDLEQGQVAIQEEQPDFVLVSSRAAENCFEIFSKTNMQPENIIFTVHENDEILNSFKFTSLNHIMKPINVIELCLMIDKIYKHRLKKVKEVQDFKIHEEHDEFKILALPTENGITFFHPKNILKCEALDENTIIQLENHEDQIVFKPLREFENQLLNDSFIRLGNKQIINLNHISNATLIQKQSIITDQIDRTYQENNKINRA